MTHWTILLLTTAFLLFGEKSNGQTIDQIAGNYSGIPECCDYNKNELIIEKKYQYINNISANLIGNSTINGTIYIKSDTIILKPKFVKNNKGENLKCSSNNVDAFCQNDTLIFKLDTLISISSNIKYFKNNQKENYLDTFLFSFQSEARNFINGKSKQAIPTEKFKALESYYISLLPKLTTTLDTSYLAKKKQELKQMKSVKSKSDSLNEKEKLLAEICLLDIENSLNYFTELITLFYKNQTVDKSKLNNSDSFCFFKAWLNQLCLTRFPNNKTFRYNMGVAFYNHGVYLNTLTTNETIEETNRRKEKAIYFLNKSKLYLKP